MQLPGDSSLPLPGITLSISSASRTNAAFDAVVVQSPLAWKVLRSPSHWGSCLDTLTAKTAHGIHSKKKKRCLTSNRCSSQCVVHLYICLPSASPLSSESFQVWVLWLRGRIVRMYIWATLLKEHRLLVSNLSSSFRLFLQKSWKSHYLSVFALLLLLSWGQTQFLLWISRTEVRWKKIPRLCDPFQNKGLFLGVSFLFNYLIVQYCLLPKR